MCIFESDSKDLICTAMASAQDIVEGITDLSISSNVEEATEQSSVDTSFAPYIIAMWKGLFSFLKIQLDIVELIDKQIIFNIETADRKIQKMDENIDDVTILNELIRQFGGGSKETKFLCIQVNRLRVEHGHLLYFPFHEVYYKIHTILGLPVSDNMYVTPDSDEDAGIALYDPFNDHIDLPVLIAVRVHHFLQMYFYASLADSKETLGFMRDNVDVMLSSNYVPTCSEYYMVFYRDCCIISINEFFSEPITVPKIEKDDYLYKHYKYLSKQWNNDERTKKLSMCQFDFEVYKRYAREAKEDTPPTSEDEHSSDFEEVPLS